jgi:hypothetical protein
MNLCVCYRAHVKHIQRMPSFLQLVKANPFTHLQSLIAGVQDWVRPIVQPYGAHMVSYRDAVWPVFEEQSPAVHDVYWELLPGSPADGIHPSWRQVTQLLAYLDDRRARHGTTVR